MTYQLRARSIAKGFATRLPLLDRLANGAAGSRVGARYFYSVWLRHLVQVHRVSTALRFDTVGELGPGDSLGLGLCALLSGARRYIGLDRIAFALKADNQAMLSELSALFAARAPIPDDDEFPGVYPRLESYEFPSHICSEARLAESLSEASLARIRAELAGTMDAASGARLAYAAPWDAATNVEEGAVDLLVSQAVLEHVDDVDAAYTAMHRWLKPDGLMSHRIDYSCHGITRDWFGHWLVTPTMWRIARGRRAYFINRLTHSRHLAALRRAGFDVLAVDATVGAAAAPAEAMQVPHETDDLRIKGAFIVARPAACA